MIFAHVRAACVGAGGVKFACNCPYDVVIRNDVKMNLLDGNFGGDVQAIAETCYAIEDGLI
jgi:hypothetical protein